MWEGMLLIGPGQTKGLYYRAKTVSRRPGS
jgi:hypothetical protein